MTNSCELGVDCGALAVVTSSLEDSIILHVMGVAKELSESDIIVESSEYIECFDIPKEKFADKLEAYLSQLGSLGLIESVSKQKYKITQHGEHINSLVDASFNHVVSLTR